MGFKAAAVSKVWTERGDVKGSFNAAGRNLE
jgi:hypothetical protein